MNEDQKYVISINVASAVLQYLATRPYQEVEQLIEALKRGEVLEGDSQEADE